MNEKLKKIVLKIEDLFEDTEIPQTIYDGLEKLSKQQPEYFLMLGAENFIKLTFLIYSYKKTQSFELGEKILNDGMFIYTLFSEGNNHREMCQECSGDGQVECNTCEGTGEIPCDECEGSGEIPCDTCDGSGIDPENEEESCWDCNGAGNRTCWNCHGSEATTCYDCDGSRLETCQSCDEIGEIETEDWDYEMEVIFSWDPYLIEQSMEVKNTLIPIISLKEYYERNNYIVIKYYGDDHLDFKKGFNSGEVYCFGYDDNPYIKLTSRGMVFNLPFGNLNNFAY
jgi:hypothetical protein